MKSLQVEPKIKLPQERKKLMLYISAKGLINTDTFSKTDGKCKVFLQTEGFGEIYLGETETIKNNLNPDWETIFNLEYYFELN